MKVQHYISSLQQTIEQIDVALVDQFIELLHDARIAGKQVFIMGNGGSASTASHFVCDLAKNTRKEGWPPFKVIGLTDNMAIFSAYANDEGYENVFAEQLASLIQTGDIVIGISASGNSPNVLKAMQVAHKYNARTIGFTGFDGGELGKMVELQIHIPSRNYGQVEDIHLMLEHMTIEALKERVKVETPAPKFEAPIPAPAFFMESAAREASQGASQVNQPERARSSMDLLYNISHEMADKLDLHTMLDRILLLTLQNMGAASGSIMVFDEDGEVIEGALAYDGEVQSRPAQQLTEIVTQGLAGWVIENRQGALIPSTQDDPRWLSRDWEQGKSRSALSVPLMSQNRVVGVLTMVHPQAGMFTHEDLALLTTIALTVSIQGKTKLVKK
jgi:D-sedoheptulose 7-phosphate isomerase